MDISKVYTVWYRDRDIYESHVLFGIYKDKFKAMAKAKELVVKYPDDKVISEEPGSKSYKDLQRYISDRGHKLIAAYRRKGYLYTVEETTVE